MQFKTFTVHFKNVNEKTRKWDFFDPRFPIYLKHNLRTSMVNAP